MSRIGKQPVRIPAGVTVTIDGRKVSVQGPRGNLTCATRPEVAVSVDQDNQQVVVTRNNDERASRAFHGLTRALINNMVQGVKDGYEKKLELQGVGYVCSVSGNQLSLRVGYANELQNDHSGRVERHLPRQYPRQRRRL